MKKYFTEIIIGGLFVAILSGLLIWFFQILKEYENRLTKLETKFDLCVDCSSRTNRIDNYEYITYKGIDVSETGEVLVEVDIDLLSEQFRWKCGSIDKIVRGNEAADLEDVIRKYRDDAELKNAKGIVCVGTASAEGNTDGEETRAKDRIETLINLVNSNLQTKKPIPIYGFNLGKYIEQSSVVCSNATLDQRRILLIKIIQRSDNLTDDKLEESLKRVLLAKAADPNISFPIDIRKYSMFTSDQTMLIYGRRN